MGSQKVIGDAILNTRDSIYILQRWLGLLEQWRESGQAEPEEAAQVLIVSRTGYVKRVPLAEFPLKGRDTQGVQSLNLTKATGPVAAATVAGPGAQFADVLSARGWRWRLPLEQVPRADRRQRGERLAPFEEDQIVKVVAL